MGTIKTFMNRNFRHYNSATVVDASKAYIEHIDNGGKMLVAMGGAMSTAEIGISLAEMIRQDKVHIISCSSNNLEEDIFNLVAHNFYERVPNWRDISIEDEHALLDRHLNRVTDTCIPEEEAMRRIEKLLLDRWIAASQTDRKYFPYEFIYQLFDGNLLEKYYQIDIEDSWVYAAWEKSIPILTPGWEDCTLGNMFTAAVIRGEVKLDCLRHGIEQMIFLTNWYKKMTDGNEQGIGFYQIGGGIAGDFPICVVPMMTQDLQMKNIPVWNYFCQISDCTTSYGSYSGAPPREKITWGKLSSETPMFMIESDATIVAPLMFNYILD